MFIGHLALGFAAKRAVPKISLAVLFVAVQLADMLWPIFLAAGIEHVRIDPGNTAVTPLDFVSYPGPLTPWYFSSSGASRLVRSIDSPRATAPPS